ncbi:RING finger domain protein [Calycina marina]|uniref:RING-type E3 ubiquitin transferase n=1 Tax=Calycina marina TaxID=1763456 RepID=A0A9P7Z4A7_9HELO|nr:RING finger domain protein [Calycina marina]
MDGHDLEVRSKILQTTLEEIASCGGTDEEETCCVICLEHVSEKAIAQPCQHESFDFLCLIIWLEERACCPLCKSDVTTVRYHFTKEDEYKTYIVPPKATTTAKPSNAPNASNRVGYDRIFTRPYRPRRQHAPRSPLSTADQAMQRRRQVYVSQTYSLHVGSNCISRYKEIAPQNFSRDEDLVSRARKWIRRELQVFEFLKADDTSRSDRRAKNAEFLLEYIVAILKTVNIQDSGGQAEDMLQEFLGRDNTKLFLHEMRSWLRSPYLNIEDWDGNVQYSETNTVKEPALISSQTMRDGDRAYEPVRRGGYRGRGWHHGARTQRADRYRPYGRNQPGFGHSFEKT